MYLLRATNKRKRKPYTHREQEELTALNANNKNEKKVNRTTSTLIFNWNFLRFFLNYENDTITPNGFVLL